MSKKNKQEIESSNKEAIEETVSESSTTNETIVTPIEESLQENISVSVEHDVIENEPNQSDIDSLHDVILTLKDKILSLQQDLEQKNTRIVSLENDLNVALKTKQETVTYSDTSLYKVGDKVTFEKLYGSLAFTISSKVTTTVYNLYSSTIQISNIPEGNLSIAE